MQSAMFLTIVRLATMPEKTSSRNVSPVGLNYSNGCADQLTNWDGTQKVGLGSVPQKKRAGAIKEQRIVTK